MRWSWGVQVMLQAVEVMMCIFAAECAPPSPFPPILTYLWLSLSGRASAPSPGTSAPCPAVGWLRRPLQCQCSAPLRPCLLPSQQASAATNWTRSKYGRLMMTPDRCCRKKIYVSVSRWYAFINVVLFFVCCWCMGIGDFSNRWALFAENQQYRLRALPHFHH